MTIHIGIGDLKSPQAWRATVAEFIAVLLLVFFGAGVALAALSVSGGTLNAANIVAIAGACGVRVYLFEKKRWAGVRLIATFTNQVKGGETCHLRRTTLA